MSVSNEQVKVIAAMVAHEVNRAYCEHLGDDSQLPWADAPRWAKESALAGVHGHAEVDLTPEESHALWCNHKKTDGWVYGETKDAVAKTHPCLVPYSDLPQEQQLKDKLFRAVVKAVLSIEVEK